MVCCTRRALSAIVAPALALTALGFLPLLSTKVEAGRKPQANDPARDGIMESFDVSDYQRMDLAIPSAPEMAPLDSLTIDGVIISNRYWSLDLKHHSLRAPDYKLIVQAPDGSYREMIAPPPTTYKGTVRDIPESVVAANVRDGKLTATILIGDQTWNIEPLQTHFDEAPVYAHIGYSNRDVTAEGFCGSDLLPDWNKMGQKDLTDPPGVSPQTNTRNCEIAFDADVEFYNQNGSSVVNTQNDIENIMNGVDNIYERDTDIVYTITQIIVRTSEPDPYSSRDAGTLLGQFQGEWNSNQGGVQRDVAHLMTGKNISGGTIGIAFLSVICNLSSAYGLSQSRFSGNYNARVALTAHELGHNWSSDHCSGSDCRIMCPGLGGCSGDLTRFGASSINQIVNFRNSRDCLDAGGTIAPLPFIENWPTTGFDSNRWSFNAGVIINTAALNEPSAPYSVNLDSSDELRSVGLELSGETLVKISYFVEARGPENGESLFLEGLNQDNEWVTVDTVTSTGAVEDNFTQRTAYLGEGFYYDGFCLRFRVDGNNGDDDWHVDDILVESIDCPAPFNYGNATPGTADITPFIFNDGGVPFIGNDNLRIRGDQLYGSAPGFLFVGFSQQVTQLGSGLWLNTLPPWIVVSFVTSGLPFPGFGKVNVPAPIPLDPTLDGVNLNTFMISADPGGPGGFNGTDGLQLQICQ